MSTKLRDSGDLKGLVDELHHAQYQVSKAESHLEDVQTELKQLLITMQGGQFLKVDMDALYRFLNGSEKMKEKPMV